MKNLEEISTLFESLYDSADYKPKTYTRLKTAFFDGYFSSQVVLDDDIDVTDFEDDLVQIVIFTKENSVPEITAFLDKLGASHA